MALEKAGKLELVKESDQENPELQGSRDNNHPMNTMVGRMAFLLICLAPMVLTDRWAEMQMIARMARDLFAQCAAAPAWKVGRTGALAGLCCCLSALDRQSC